MARAHFVKKAQKDHPEGGIKKGDSYYWWAFMVGGRGGPKHYSKTQPKASQLTQSAYYGAVADIGDAISALSADDGLEDAAKEIAGSLNELADEQEEKLNNMPDSLQSGSTGEQLQERTDACRQAAEELEGISYGDFESNKEGDESEEDYWNRILDEVQGVSLPD